MLTIVGSEPMTSLLITPATGEPLVLEGAPARALRSAAGLEVRVDGTRTGARVAGAAATPTERFDVRSFVVRASDGAPAVDGTLLQQGVGYALRLADGTVRTIVGMPAGLREHVGARVFLVGAAGAAPSAYGVLVPAR